MEILAFEFVQEKLAIDLPVWNVNDFPDSPVRPSPSIPHIEMCRIHIGMVQYTHTNHEYKQYSNKSEKIFQLKQKLT